MKPKAEFKNGPWVQFKNILAIQLGVRLIFLTALGLALTVCARAETQPAAIPFANIGAKATEDYKGDALGITATSDGARLRCGFQKLEGHATSEGLWLESTEPGAAGKLRLTATTLRREDHSNLNSQPSTTLPATGTVSVEDKLVRFTRPGVTEEYTVSVDGVRQDFVIVAPPNGTGDLRVELALSGARAEATAYGARLTLEGSGRGLAYGRLRVMDATGRELTARLEVLSSDRLAVNVTDANAAYPVRIDPTFSDANWVSLNPGIEGANRFGIVRAMASDDNGNVYFGGDFTSIATVSANRIAKWDGHAWSALGSGVSYSVSALAVSGTNLYAGGYFTTAGGVLVNYIAKWDGSAWSPLGSGMNNTVDALAVSGNDLYAGGSFTDAGGVTARGIARWNGSSWSALGSGLDGQYTFVNALAVSGTNLYVGGWFTTAGGMSARYIAKWNGSAWSALGSGMSHYVHALAVSGTELYAGGEFTAAGGVPANYIAKWNGNAWSALGSGMSNQGACHDLDPAYVRVLAVSGTNLYVGGHFTTAGGSIAKWNGSSWSAVGSGLGSGITWDYNIHCAVLALAVSGTTLYAGGTFTKKAGGGCIDSPTPADYIAKWDGLGSAPTILMPPQTQTAEAGGVVNLSARVTGLPPPTYQWFFNGTNAVSDATTNSGLVLTSVQFSQSGPYVVVVSNVLGAVTSAPAMLNVIAPVEHRPVPQVKVTGEAGSLLNLDYANTLSPAPNWTTLGSVSLTSTSQLYFDLTTPLPPQRFYRAWQTGTPGAVPSLNLNFVPAITLTGNVGDTVRLDYINAIGPTDAWVTLDTVTLTNTSQLYFDISAPGQPRRLYRIVPVP